MNQKMIDLFIKAIMNNDYGFIYDNAWLFPDEFNFADQKIKRNNKLKEAFSLINYLSRIKRKNQK